MIVYMLRSMPCISFMDSWVANSCKISKEPCIADQEPFVAPKNSVWSSFFSSTTFKHDLDHSIQIIRSLYGISVSKLRRYYRNVLSGFRDWEHRENAIKMPDFSREYRFPAIPAWNQSFSGWASYNYEQQRDCKLSATCQNDHLIEK